MKLFPRYFPLLLCATLTSLSAQADSTADDILRYSTLGVWAGAPLGLSARAGLAISLDKETALTVGGEAGLYGSKQFVGLRSVVAAHGVFWGGIDFAHWKTGAHPFIAEPHTDYYGFEIQMAIFRAGLMLPTDDRTGPRLTLGTGFSF